jgi:hypothetical protein
MGYVRVPTHLDTTPRTAAGWRTDAIALRALASDLDRGLMPDWCNPQWLLALALKIEKIGGAA